jgi:uncharacterized repeat protein (TIGR03803 family)
MGAKLPFNVSGLFPFLLIFPFYEASAMRIDRLVSLLRKTWPLIFFLALAACALGQVETVIYDFSGDTDGANPDCKLVADGVGNLYGTVPAKANGEVFELSPPATPGGTWTKKVIYKFKGSPDDGNLWPAATLVWDKEGNLYGETGYGGTNGTGTVFELSPPTPPHTNWTEKILYNFPAGYSYGKAESPGGTLTWDGAGNLYGTAGGGIGDCFSNGCGTIFQLKKPATPDGAWRSRVIYAFGAFAGDATVPASGFVFRSGVLYGVSANGGTNGNGTLFTLSQTNGVWSETILHSFTADEGSAPSGWLVGDSAGNLYTSLGGGKFPPNGQIVMLSPPASPGASWQMTSLHSFHFNDGDGPSSVIRDKDGNLYGTAVWGGLLLGGGTVFKLLPPSTPGGRWSERTLYKFTGYSVVDSVDGWEPYIGIILVNGKGLFGTTHYGGSAYQGTVFNVALP